MKHRAFISLTFGRPCLSKSIDSSDSYEYRAGVSSSATEAHRSHMQKAVSLALYTPWISNECWTTLSSRNTLEAHVTFRPAFSRSLDIKIGVSVVRIDARFEGRDSVGLTREEAKLGDRDPFGISSQRSACLSSNRSASKVSLDCR